MTSVTSRVGCTAESGVEQRGPTRLRPTEPLHQQSPVGRRARGPLLPRRPGRRQPHLHDGPLQRRAAAHRRHEQPRFRLGRRHCDDVIRLPRPLPTVK